MNNSSHMRRVLTIVVCIALIISISPAFLRVKAVQLKSDAYLTVAVAPEDYIGRIGDTAEFKVEATGEDLSYQWQLSQNDGKSWIDYGSHTQSRLQLEITLYRAEYAYRCRVSDKHG